VTRALSLTLLALLLATLAAAEPLSGRVVRIYDGDTLVVDGIGEVRLLGIDAPEHEASQRDGYYVRRGIAPATLRRIAAEAKRYLQRQAQAQTVRLDSDATERDRYGRRLAYVYLPDGRLLNRLLLDEGLAVVYRRFAFVQKDAFLAAESLAQQRGVGLWRTPGKDEP